MSLTDYLKAGTFIRYEQMREMMNKKPLSEVSPEQKQLLSELKQNGVIVLPNYYTEDRCNEIITHIDKMIDDDSINVQYDGVKSDARVFASHRYSETIKEFHTDPFLRQVGEAYSGCELINSHTLGAKLTAQKNNLGSGGGWHRDSVYQTQYKSIVYLTDVDEDHGPFEYILGSHDKESVLKSIKENGFSAHHNRFTEEEIEAFLKSNPNYSSKVFTAKKGSVILVDTCGVHRGTPIATGNRYALTNYYFLKHQYNKKAKEKFEKLF